MLYPDEPGKAEPSNNLHHWAQLESKSDSMADELVRNLQSSRRRNQEASRFSNALVSAVLLTVCVGLAIAVLHSKDETDPPANSATVSTDIHRLDPQ